MKKVGKYVVTKKSLGKGAFSEVFLAYLQQQPDKEMAVKIIKRQKLGRDSYQLNALFNEISILKKLKSENVVGLQDVLETQNNYYIFQQLCKEGDLRQLIKHVPPEHVTLSVIRDILRGFISLIKAGIIHRDIKPQNIFLKGKVAKIADFGLARLLNNFRNQRLSSMVGTPLYMSPQILKEEPYNFKTDIWSLGIIFYEMLTGTHPYKARSQTQMLRRIGEQKLQFPERISAEIRDFISRCLSIEQQKRFNWEQLFNHPLFCLQFQDFCKTISKLQTKSIYVINRLRIKVIEMNIDVEQLFKDVDYSKDNKIDRIQFFKMILTIDPLITEEEAIYIFQKFDGDGNGHIDFQEFKQWTTHNDVRPTQNSIRNQQISQCIKLIKQSIKQIGKSVSNIFTILDVDDSDNLDIQEFSKLLQVFKMNDLQIKAVFNQFDLNGDGFITKKQMVTRLKKVNGQPPDFEKSTLKRLQDFLIKTSKKT